MRKPCSGLGLDACRIQAEKIRRQRMLLPCGVVSLRFLHVFASYFIYIARAAWALTFLGLLVSLTKMLTWKEN